MNGCHNCKHFKNGACTKADELFELNPDKRISIIEFLIDMGHLSDVILDALGGDQHTDQFDVYAIVAEIEAGITNLIESYVLDLNDSELEIKSPSHFICSEWM